MMPSHSDGKGEQHMSMTNSIVVFAGNRDHIIVQQFQDNDFEGIFRWVNSYDGFFIPSAPRGYNQWVAEHTTHPGSFLNDAPRVADTPEPANAMIVMMALILMMLVVRWNRKTSPQ
jgi:hypothetical protein